MNKKNISLIVILFLLFTMFGCNFPNKKTAELKSNNFVITESPTMKKLNTVYPELYGELLKLPELKENTDKNKHAVEQIARLGLSSKYKPAFESILNEGLKNKRKYCTPLEALLWLAYDKNFDKSNPLDNFDLSSLIRNAWSYTSTSNNFLSKRWSDFDEVTDRLNSPLIIAIYTQLNFKYNYIQGEKEGIKSVKQIFKDKEGACFDIALFATYLLQKNGYAKAWPTAVLYDKTSSGYGGHVANIYIDQKDNHYYSMDFDIDCCGYDVYGPFTSLDAAVNHICSFITGGKGSLIKYKCYNIDLTKGIYIKASDYFYTDF